MPMRIILKYPQDCFKNILGDHSVMVSEAKGRLFRRKDGKYLLYIPVDLAEDSMFPFKATSANPKVRVKISFKIGDKKLTIEKWKEETGA